MGIAVLGFILVVLLDAALRYGLWGEFAFTLVATSVAVWALARVLPDTSIAFWQAPVWAALPLVGLPLAIVSRPLGIVVFVGVLLIAYFALWPWRSAPAWAQPIQWLAALAAVAAIVVFAFARVELGGAERVKPGVRGLAPQTWSWRSATGRSCSSTATSSSCRWMSRLRSRTTGWPSAASRSASSRAIPSSVRAISMQATSSSRSATRGSGRATRPGATLAYYYRVSSARSRVYVDYWWYYAWNPLPVAKRFLCGPGLRIPEVSCFEHPADWEGVTVVLARCGEFLDIDTACVPYRGESLHLVAVHYAQHRHVVARSWADLEQLWTKRALGDLRDGGGSGRSCSLRSTATRRTHSRADPVAASSGTTTVASHGGTTAPTAATTA